MNYEEFYAESEKDEEEQPVDTDVELDVQKAVVESLAADKAELAEKISALKKENEALEKERNDLLGEMEKLRNSIFETILKNSETPLSNKVALLDREMELPDRFEGESRDHVIEVIREARDRCEEEGRLRRAQILEAVLVANEPNGKLAEKRKALEKLFSDNQNILSGQVINELDNLGIKYKDGENYLLPSEIIKRTF